MRDSIFQYTWLNGSEIYEDTKPRDPDEALLASFAVIINGIALTANTNKTTNITQDQITVSLYSLAKWLTGNYFFLKYQTREQETENYFETSHNIFYANGGYSWPNIEFKRQNDTFKITCNNKMLGNRSIYFNERNTELEADSNLVLKSIAKIVDDCCLRLKQFGFGDDKLIKDWKMTNELSKEQEDYIACAAALGYDALNPDDLKLIGNNLELIDNYIPAEDVYEFCTILNADSFLKQAKTIDTQVKELALKSTSPRLDSIGQHLVTKTNGKKAWETGFKMAKKFRKQFNLSETILKGELQDSLIKLGFGTYEQVFQPIEFTLPHLKSIVTGFKQQPVIGIVSARPDNIKFNFWASLFRYYNRNRQSDTVFLTDFPSAINKASRAFSAEMLAPGIVLKKEFGKRQSVSIDEIKHFAEVNAVPEDVIVNRINDMEITQINY